MNKYSSPLLMLDKAYLQHSGTWIIFPIASQQTGEKKCQIRQLWCC